MFHQSCCKARAALKLANKYNYLGFVAPANNVCRMEWAEEHGERSVIQSGVLWYGLVGSLTDRQKD